MWTLVSQQAQNACRAWIERDKQLAHDVVCRERKVNALELRIDSECEDIIARYGPVAIDLRFVLAMFKINTSMERMGDFAESIARAALNMPDGAQVDDGLLALAELETMSRTALGMFSAAREALEQERSELAEQVIRQDMEVDQMNSKALANIAAHLEQYPQQAYVCLDLMNVVRKLERFGDHCTNIAEEIIFYLDAKVIKHAEHV